MTELSTGATVGSNGSVRWRVREERCESLYEPSRHARKRNAKRSDSSMSLERLTVASIAFHLSYAWIPRTRT